MKQCPLPIIAMLGSILLLAGCATSRPSQATPRYQLSSWAYGTDNRTQTGFYVIDTWTGEVWSQDGKKLEKISEVLRSRPSPGH